MEQQPEEAPLAPPTKSLFLARLAGLDDLPVNLPYWAQSGPYGFPAACANEQAWFIFRIGWHGLETQVLPPITNLGNSIKNWILSQFDEYQTPEELTGAYESWASANSIAPWAEEVP